MNRYEKVWGIRQICIKASNNKLYNDYGDVLKRVVSQGYSMPTKIGFTDVLQAWKWQAEKDTVAAEGDEDGIQVVQEVSDRIASLWDKNPDDLIYQSDGCIDYLSSHLPYEPRRYGPGANRKATRPSRKT